MKNILGLLMGIFFFSWLACEDDVEPNVTYLYGSCFAKNENVTSSTAVLTGYFRGEVNVKTVKEFGFLYSTSSTVQVDDSATQKVALKESFVVNDYDYGGDGYLSTTYKTNLSKLSAGTKYYCCFFVSNGKNIVRSEIGDFMTLPLSKPLLGEVIVDSKGEHSLSVHCFIENDGGHDISTCGFSYKKKEELESAYSNREAQKDTTSFSATIIGLTPGATYQIRPYVLIENETVKGTPYEVTMDGIEAPEVTTIALEEKTYGATFAYLQGNVVSDGASKVIQRGFYFSKNSPDPSITDSVILVDSTSVPFRKMVSDLEPDQTYYYKAFATNATKTGTGQSMTFKTQSLTTYYINDPYLVSSTDRSLTVNASTNSNKDEIKETGFCYSTTNLLPEKDRNGDGFVKGSFSGEEMVSAVIDGLNPDTEYYVRSYVLTSEGKYVYSERSTSMRTSQKQAVSISLEYKDLTSTSVYVSVNVKTTGGVNTSEVGILFSEKTPTWEDKGSGTTQYKSSSQRISDLAPEKTYHVRGYAIVSGKNEPLLGEVQSITTLSLGGLTVSCDKPTLVNTEKGTTITIHQASATSEDNEVRNHITEMGYCYSASNSSPTKDNCDKSDKLSENNSIYNQSFLVEKRGKIYMRIYAVSVVSGKTTTGYSAPFTLEIGAAPGENDNDEPKKEN